MGVGDYLEGVAFALPTWAAVAGAVALLLRRTGADLRGHERACAAMLLGLAGLIGVHLLPGLAGILSRPAVVVTALALLALTHLATRQAGEPPRAPEADAGTDRDAATVVLLAVPVVAVAFLALFVLDRGGLMPTGVDAVAFQLPAIAAFVESGAVWPVVDFAPDWAFGAYPHHGELVDTAVVLPFDSLGLVRPLHVLLLLASAVAVYGLARQLGARRDAAAAAGGLVVALPASLVPAAESGKTDALLVLALAAGTVFLLRWREGGRPRDLVLGAIGLGLAVATKWYGIPAAAIVAGLLLVDRLAARVAPRALARDAALGAAVVLGVGGVWLLRNLVELGNPLFPADVGLGPLTIFGAPPDTSREVFGPSLLDFAGDRDAWRDHILPEFRRAFAGPGIVMACGALLALGAGVRSRFADRVVGGVGLAALLLLAMYVVLPYTAQTLGGEDPLVVGAAVRYAVPGLAFGAAAGAAVLSRSPRAALAGGVLALVATFDGLRHVGDFLRDAEVDDHAGVARLLPASLALGAVLSLAALPAARDRRVAAALAAVVLVVLIAAGQRHLDRFQDSQALPAGDAVASAVRDLSAADPQVVGVVGATAYTTIVPLLPAAGPRLENRVVRLGRRDEGFWRAPGSEQELRRLLEDERVDLLQVFRPDPARPRPEEAWARRAGFTEVARGPGTVLLRAR